MTITVPQDSNKRKVQSNEGAHRGGKSRNKQNEGDDYAILLRGGSV